MASLICSECGKKFSDKEEMCPSCGCPTANMITEEKELEQQAVQKRNGKLLGIGIVAAAIVVIIVTATYLISKSNMRDCYNGIKWNTTFDSLAKKISGDDVLIDDGKGYIMERIENFNKMEGVYATISYYFTDEELFTIDITLHNNEEDTGMSSIELKEKLNDNFTKLYGEGEESDNKKIWRTENSMLVVDSFNNMVTLKYMDIDRVKD